jgi:hypothetical protein
MIIDTFTIVYAFYRKTAIFENEVFVGAITIDLKEDKQDASKNKNVIHSKVIDKNFLRFAIYIFSIICK